MNLEDIGQLNNLQNLVDITNEPDDDSNWQMLDSALCGNTALKISNHGGELKEILQKLSDECQKIKR